MAEPLNTEEQHQRLGGCDLAVDDAVLALLGVVVGRYEFDEAGHARVSHGVITPCTGGSPSRSPAVVSSKPSASSSGIQRRAGCQRTVAQCQQLLAQNRVGEKAGAPLPKTPSEAFSANPRLRLPS